MTATAITGASTSAAMTSAPADHARPAPWRRSCIARRGAAGAVWASDIGKSLRGARPG